MVSKPPTIRCRFTWTKPISAVTMLTSSPALPRWVWGRSVAGGGGIAGSAFSGGQVRAGPLVRKALSNLVPLGQGQIPVDQLAAGLHPGGEARVPQPHRLVPAGAGQLPPV